MRIVGIFICPCQSVFIPHKETLRDAVSLVSLLTSLAAQRLNSYPAQSVFRYLQLVPNPVNTVVQ